MTRIATPAELADLAAAIEAAPLVAVDTEFHAERRYLPKLLLVQIHVPDAGIWIVDPLVEGSLDIIAEPLRATPWLLHAGRQDLRILHAALGAVPERVIDTQVAHGLCTPSFPAAYAELAHTWLGVRLSKDATLSDWSRRPLGTEQLRYAADDVRLLPALWERLRARLVELERADLAERAFASARRVALQPARSEDAWRSLSARDVLDDPSLAAAARLAAWRLERARERDEPVRGVLSDGLLVDLARRRPATVNRILSNRRFPKRLARRLGPELVAQLRAAASTAPPRRIARHTGEGRALQVVRAAIEELGVQACWSQALVLPDPLLEDHILAARHGEAPPPLDDWRDALAGDPLRALLRGEIAARLAPRAGGVILDPKIRH